MRRLLILVAALSVLAAPATASAAKPSKADRREAQKECRAERGTTEATQEAFKAEYRNFGACVSQKAREAKSERSEARREAKEACREERSADRKAFKEKYGSMGLGRCVNQQTKAKQAEEDAQDAEEIEDRKNAAQECDEERGETAATRKAFEDKYGTNANKKNAFGKCVSEKAKEDDES